MFSGIIADVGTISRALDRDGGLRLSVSTEDLGWMTCHWGQHCSQRRLPDRDKN